MKKENISNFALLVFPVFPVFPVFCFCGFAVLRFCGFAVLRYCGIPVFRLLTNFCSKDVKKPVMNGLRHSLTVVI